MISEALLYQHTQSTPDLIAGSKAVVLWLRDGSQLRIGTDEPAQLLGAIQKSRHFTVGG